MKPATTKDRTFAVEYRWAEGHYERLPDLAADLVRRNVAVIVAAPTPATLVAKEATTTIPIVFELGVDPVASGVASLSRPGGNITGIVNLGTVLVAKRIEVMHQIVPDAKLIAVLLNPDNPTVSDADMNNARAAKHHSASRCNSCKHARSATSKRHSPRSSN